MKKRLLAAAVAGAVMLSAGAQAQDTAAPEGYQLQQVLIMSRHNLRAPLANNGSVLEQSTAKAWPQWDVPGGQLTTKGGVLEVYMGHYMREWLAQQKLVTSGECPPENAVYAYANSLQRTVATAQFFITGAFPGCGIPVHHQPQMGTMDPTFNPVIDVYKRQDHARGRRQAHRRFHHKGAAARYWGCLAGISHPVYRLTRSADPALPAHVAGRSAVRRR